MHCMKLNPIPFEKIKNKEKTIELRLYDEKRQAVKENDLIEFTNAESGEVITARVVKMHIFKSFSELYATLPLTKCGYTQANLHEAQPSDMEQYYSPDEQKKYGVVGIEICLL